MTNVILISFMSLFNYIAFLAKEVLKAIRITVATFHVRLKNSNN